MRNRDEKKDLQQAAQVSSDQKRKHLVFIGPESVLIAQAHYVSCCMYVSQRSHRHYN